MQASEQDRKRFPADRVMGPPPPRIPLPPMTLALIGVNVLMALVEFAASGYRWMGGELGTGPIAWALGAKVPSLVANGEYWRLITASFLHGSWLHLAFNMLALLALGRLIEMFYGPLRMLVIFILSAVVGTVVSYKFSMTVSLGASTGVLGLMGALLYHNLKYRAHLPERLNALYPFLIFLLAIQFMMDSANRDIDILGHVGGLIGGVVVSVLLESRFAGALQDERDWLPLPTALATVAALLAYGAVGLVMSLPQELPLLRAARSGDVGLEVRQLREAIQHRPYFVEARLQLVEYLLWMNRGEDAMNEYRHVIDENPSLLRSGEAEPTQKNLARYFRIRATVAESQSRSEEALVCLRHVLDLGLDPEFRFGSELEGPSLVCEANNEYAWILADKLNRNLDDAERCARTALALQPTDGAIWDTFAWVLYHKGDYSQALAEELRALDMVKANPSLKKAALPETLLHLGAIHEKLGQVDEARKAYESALVTDPEYLPAKEALRHLEPGQIPGRPSVPSTAPTAPARTLQVS